MELQCLAVLLVSAVYNTTYTINIINKNLNAKFCYCTDIRVKEGDSVEKGQPLVVLSAMKMEMVVQAPRAGKVKKLEITNGMKLEGEDLILVLE